MDKELLLELAEDVGPNGNRLAEDWDGVTVEESTESAKMPMTEVGMDDIPWTREGYVGYERPIAALHPQDDPKVVGGTTEWNAFCRRLSIPD